jgi:virginiamycin B lyase
MRNLLIVYLAIPLALPLALAAADKKPAAAPRGGIKTPGVQIPIALLKAEAEIDAAPAFIGVGSGAGSGVADLLLIPDRKTAKLFRLDPKTNKLAEPVPGVDKPCGGAIAAFGSIWTPSCADHSLLRIDAKKWKVSAKIATGTGAAPVSIAASSDSIWIFSDNRTTLTRVDPGRNQAVAEIRLPAGCSALAFGEAALWAACPAEDRVLRINPLTNLVEKRIEVSAQPLALALGEGSVWVLCEKDGKVDRIDPKTNKVGTHIDLGVAGAAGVVSERPAGGIAVGLGSVWITLAGFPLTRIDPAAEKVVQQFWGAGGGAIQIAANAIWLSNVAEGTLWRLDPKRVQATLAE